jgi:5-methylcytosine-specific restriction enzyme subunit McrC
MIPRLPAGAIEWGRRELKFTQFCGVVSIGSVILEVLPKIAAVAQARSVLIRMLSVTGQLTTTEQSVRSKLGLQTYCLLDCFIKDFCDQLDHRLRQGGPIQRYKEQVEDLTTVRGRIELGDQLRHNARRLHFVRCRYELRTIDNAFNQVIRTVLRKILPLTLNSEVRRRVNEILLKFDGVADVQRSAKDAAAIVVDRTIAQWTSIFEICVLLLRGIFPDVRGGGQDALGLLFDMNKLFEAYVAVLVRRCAEGTGATVRVQGPLAYLASDEASKAVVRLRPDISVMDRDGRLTLIIDAKWKELGEQQERAPQPSPADIYQMSAYATRYQCPRLMLVYPGDSMRPSGRIKRFTLMNIPSDIDIALLDIQAAVANGSPPGWLADLVRADQGSQYTNR